MLIIRPRIIIRIHTPKSCVEFVNCLNYRSTCSRCERTTCGRLSCKWRMLPTLTSAGWKDFPFCTLENGTPDWLMDGSVNEGQQTLLTSFIQRFIWHKLPVLYWVVISRENCYSSIIFNESQRNASHLSGMNVSHNKPWILISSYLQHHKGELKLHASWASWNFPPSSWKQENNHKRSMVRNCQLLH